MNHKKTAGAGFRTTAAMAGIGAMVAGAGLIGAATAIAAPDESAIKSSTSTSASETSSTSSKAEKTDEGTSTSTSTSKTQIETSTSTPTKTETSEPVETEITKTSEETPIPEKEEEEETPTLTEDQEKFKAALEKANGAMSDADQMKSDKIDYAVKNMDTICKDWSSKAQCGETLATHPLGKKLNPDDTLEQLQEKVIDSKFKQPTPAPSSPSKEPESPAPSSPSKEPEPTTRTQTQTVTERESTVERSTTTRSAEPRPAEPRQTVTGTRTTQRSAEPSSTSARPERPTDTSTSTSTRPTRTSTSARPAGERTLAARPSREKEPPLVYSEASEDESTVSPWMWGLGAVLLAGFGVAGWYLYKSYKGAGSGSDGTGTGA